ncbi:MAG: hypothetical protein WDZ30_12700 [Cellvibrionaceae bacterium]
MNDTTGLTIRDIFHFRYGICQMVFFAPAKCWIGLNEKKQSLWAPDRKGHPDMDRVRKPQYLYREQLPYLEILNPHFQPDCMVLSMNTEDEGSLA